MSANKSTGKILPLVKLNKRLNLPLLKSKENKFQKAMKDLEV
jgi:hypothetical protein